MTKTTNDQVILRNSERKLFKECQWKWEREYVDRLKPRRQESVALWFGTGIHLALEEWYVTGKKRGVDPRKTWKQYVYDSDAEMRYVNTSDPLGDFDQAVQALELGEDMLEGYLAEYGNDDDWEVLGTELDFQIRMPYDRLSNQTGDDLTPPHITREKDDAIVVGTIDLVFRDHSDGTIWLLDHKTAKALGTNNTQFLPMDDQAGLYCAVAERVLKAKGLIGQDERVSGIVYNYLAKRKGDTRPRNAAGLATNKPVKQDYIDALTELGPLVKADPAELKKLKVADLEKRAHDLGVTVLGAVSKQQPQPRFERKTVRRTPAKNRNQLKRVQTDLTSMSLVRDNVLKPTKTTGVHCSFCPFLEICQLDEDGKDWSDMADQMYKTWDPYESHRKELS